jgi:DNA-directed RNA polymerase specialized sigma24 family protein
VTTAVFEKACTVARAAAAGEEDAAQEGVIRAWEILAADPRKPAPYVHAAVRNRVREIASGAPQLGSPRGKNAREASTRLSGLDLAEWDAPVVEGDRDTAIVVRAAVAALPDERDRAIVFLHFWRGLTFDEIGPRVGLSRGGASNRWWRVIAPALREQLRHLVEPEVSE